MFFAVALTPQASPLVWEKNNKKMTVSHTLKGSLSTTGLGLMEVFITLAAMPNVFRLSACLPFRHLFGCFIFYTHWPVSPTPPSHSLCPPLHPTMLDHFPSGFRYSSLLVPLFPIIFTPPLSLPRCFLLLPLFPTCPFPPCSPSFPSTSSTFTLYSLFCRSAHRSPWHPQPCTFQYFPRLSCPSLPFSRWKCWLCPWRTHWRRSKLAFGRSMMRFDGDGRQLVRLGAGTRCRTCGFNIQRPCSYLFIDVSSSKFHLIHIPSVTPIVLASPCAHAHQHEMCTHAHTNGFHSALSWLPMV